MNKIKSLIQLTITLIFIFWNVALGGQEDPKGIFHQVMDNYRSLPTYQAEGTVESDIDLGSGQTKLRTYFSMQLKKPNSYKITWRQELGSGLQQGGAIWNRGSQPFLYMKSMNAYSKLDNDLAAISTATGISGGVAFTIPSLFFPFLQRQQSPFSRLIAPTLEKIESVAGEDCFVISGRSKLSQRETYWISTKSYLIRQYSRKHMLQGKDYYPQEDVGLDIEDVLNDLGKDLTEENQKELEKIMREQKKYMKRAKIKNTSKEVHEKISLGSLFPKDFDFRVPAGTRLKDKLF